MNLNCTLKFNSLFLFKNVLKMMKNLLLKEGEIIEVKYVNLEVARFVKFQPQSVDFLEISNPKAV